MHSLTHVRACARAHTHAHVYTRMNTQKHTPTHMDAHTHKHTHKHTRQDGGTEEKLLKIGFQGKFERTDRQSMAKRRRKLAADSWNLVKERSLTTRLCAQG